ncbi:YveK family protein [Acetobacterium wieringae]|uniref:Capsular polysaccharide type 8 biosynthesis protein cap8A n=1 Tax=Acetobacterium wieringae TaxID=52694 RepID=A0A1F2PJY1_9FIRM|nr:Wzz/FepE/Etk N-terminal domain-containing protein [Acetobacterium wieringae]OFV71325.1 capsular polysaccharide type 8 biosynthesis protein cap8A [Acetobacterium wieringae]
MEEISLREILDLLQENWKMIVIITLVLVGLAAAVTLFFIDKTYNSSTTLIVGRPEGYTSTVSDTANELRINQQLVGTYSEIAKSKSVMTEVNSALNLGLSDGQLAEMITVSTVNDTELIKISVTSEDPVLAASIANKTAEKFMTNVAELMKINNLQIVDEAVVNSAPVGPNLKLNMAIAFLMGIICSVGIIFVKEALNTTVKTIDQLKKLADDVSIIGVIPECDELTLKGGN